VTVLHCEEFVTV